MWNTLKPGSCITGSIGSRPSSACGLGRGVATTVGVLEHVELHRAQPEVELLGEGGVRVLDRGRERGEVGRDGLRGAPPHPRGGRRCARPAPGSRRARPPGPARPSWWWRRRRPRRRWSRPPSPPSSLARPPMRTLRPSRPTACPPVHRRRVGNTRTYAESHLERIDQLRPGQHPDQAVRGRVPQERELQPARLPHRVAHQVQEGVRRRRRGGAGRGTSSRATSCPRAPTSPWATTSWPPSTPRPAARSTSRSSSTWPTSTRSSTTPPTTSPPTRPPPSPTPSSPRRWRRRARSAWPGS